MTAKFEAQWPLVPDRSHAMLANTTPSNLPNFYLRSSTQQDLSAYDLSRENGQAASPTLTLNGNSKRLFCRVDGCPQSEAAAAARAKSANQPLTSSFSSKKDRARHEAKHNPGIKCEWRGPEGEECGRVFSRMDNMKDHVRRIHNKGQQQQQTGGQGSSRK